MNKILILNHKSGLSQNEIKNYILNVNDILRTDETTIICPSNIHIPYFNGKYNFYLGSQNISPININGETTGNVLKSAGVKYTLIGHPERINHLNETSKMINNKIKEALKNNITPIIIIGETFYQYELRKTGEIITKQLKEYLDKVEVDKDIIFVYEPNWNFTGKQIPKLEHITEVVDLIKNIIKINYNIKPKVLYGGNITKENIQYIIKVPNIDGYLLGKSSTNLQELQQILNIIE